MTYTEGQTTTINGQPVKLLTVSDEGQAEMIKVTDRDGNRVGVAIYMGYSNWHLGAQNGIIHGESADDIEAAVYRVVELNDKITAQAKQYVALYKECPLDLKTVALDTIKAVTNSVDTIPQQAAVVALRMIRNS